MEKLTCIILGVGSNYDQVTIETLNTRYYVNETTKIIFGSKQIYIGDLIYFVITNDNIYIEIEKVSEDENLSVLKELRLWLK